MHQRLKNRLIVRSTITNQDTSLRHLFSSRNHSFNGNTIFLVDLSGWRTRPPFVNPDSFSRASNNSIPTES
ncbi:hypothetical protein Hanom_Chr06g00490181 [Helianthus anomalus]